MKEQICVHTNSLSLQQQQQQKPEDKGKENLAGLRLYTSIIRIHMHFKRTSLSCISLRLSIRFMGKYFAIVNHETGPCKFNLCTYICVFKMFIIYEFVFGRRGVLIFA